MLASGHPKTFADRLGSTNRLSLLLQVAGSFARPLRRRWRLYRMQWLDDHMLDDIGITREELEWAIRLPLRVNAALALHDRARRRRTG